jgi:hypothetical protein
VFRWSEAPAASKEAQWAYNRVSTVPSIIIAKYIYNTRKYSLQPELLDKTAKYMAMCGQTIKSTGNGSKHIATQKLFIILLNLLINNIQITYK